MTAASRQVRPQAIAQPAQVLHIGVVDRRRERDLEGQQSPVVARHDQVDLVVAARGPQMRDRGSGALRIDADRERHEGLEQRAEQTGRLVEGMGQLLTRSSRDPVLALSSLAASAGSAR